MRRSSSPSPFTSPAILTELPRKSLTVAFPPPDTGWPTRKPFVPFSAPSVSDTGAALPKTT